MSPALYVPARAKIAWIDFTSFWLPTAASDAMIIWASTWPLKTTSRPSGSSVGCGADHRPSPRSSTCNTAGTAPIVLSRFADRR